MFIKDLVMWRHYNVILENSNITTRPLQRLAIHNNLNHLSANVISKLLVLNIKGKINKIAIKTRTMSSEDLDRHYHKNCLLIYILGKIYFVVKCLNLVLDISSIVCFSLYSPKSKAYYFILLGPSCSWSYGCDFDFRSGWGVLDTTLCDKNCSWLATGWWFSPPIK